MQRMDSEHRELVQHVAQIDATTILNKRKKMDNPYSQTSSAHSSSSNSSSSASESNMDYPDDDSPSPPTSPYDAMRRIQQHQESPGTDTVMPDMCPPATSRIPTATMSPY
eukprot:scaffold1493_cov160-Cylindrotheca_fusiformis.AAC.3